MLKFRKKFNFINAEMEVRISTGLLDTLPYDFLINLNIVCATQKEKKIVTHMVCTRFDIHKETILLTYRTYLFSCILY